MHISIVLFQCHVAQCLASWGAWPPCPRPLNPPLPVHLLCFTCPALAGTVLLRPILVRHAGCSGQTVIHVRTPTCFVSRCCSCVCCQAKGPRCIVWSSVQTGGSSVRPRLSAYFQLVFFGLLAVFDYPLASLYRLLLPPPRRLCFHVVRLFVC